MNMNVTRQRNQQLFTPEDVALENMNKLLSSWSKDLEQSYKAVLEQGKKLDEESRQKAVDAQKAYQQEQLDAALDREVASYLGALRVAAQDRGSQVAIPEGVRAASSLTGPSLAIDDLLRDIRIEDRPDDRELARGAKDAQTSAAWALGQGLMPHPLDLSTLLRAGQADGAWSEHFASLGARLEAVDRRPAPNVQLQMVAGAERLSTLRDFVDALGAYSSERLLTAIVAPEQLRGTSAPILPLERTRGAMTAGAFNAMMDGLFAKPRAR